MPTISKSVPTDVMALTETNLKKHYGKKRNDNIDLPDRDGLGARVGKSGKISWIFRYRFDGQQKRLTFASYPATSLTEAREQAINFVRVLEAGEDPKYANQDEATVTIEHCRSEWLKHRVATLKPTTQLNYNSVADKYFTNERFPHCVQKARFEYWLSFFDGIAKETSKVNSGNILKITKNMLRFCLSRNVIQKSRVFDIDLKAVGETAKVGQRRLDLKEVGRLWVTIDQSIAKPSMKACTKLLIIFGARQSEIREAPRDEFDLNSMIWELPPERSKTGKAVRRAIPEKAAELIRQLDSIYGAKGYLIKGLHPNTCATAHALNRYVKRSWGKMAAVEKTKEFTPHDFRRTLSTRLSERGVLPHVTEKMLGHELGGVMAVYNKHDWIDEQGEAYNMWCKMIEEAASKALGGFSDL